jgi:hypothetical protein
MSYDLAVISERRPTQAMLDAALAAAADGRPPPVQGGSLDDDGAYLNVGEPGGGAYLEVEAPVRVDRAWLREVGADGPLHDAAPQAAGRASWWLELHVPAAGGDAGVELAERLAARLARAAGGVVFDPQRRQARPPGPADGR